MHPLTQPLNPEVAADLAAVRRRRAELRESLVALEQALAAPAAGCEERWASRVHRVLLAFADDFAEHIVVTEGPEGLHQAISSAEPRLTHAVTLLVGDHQRFSADLAELVAISVPPLTATEVTVIRDLGTHLVADVSKHRQRGADLIYEAYETDIGVGD